MKYQDVDYKIAAHYSDKDCVECKGKGYVVERMAADDSREVYCICAVNNREEAKAESREDDKATSF